MQSIKFSPFIGLSVLLFLAHQATATVIVRVEPADTTVYTGNNFNINLMADISDPVIGWGLDLTVDNPAMAVPYNVTIGPLWQSVFAPDGDGLAALAWPASISGNDILLATISFTAGATIGGTDLIPGITAGDDTEGFPLAPVGFDQITFVPGHITVLPEPTTFVLLALCGFITLRRREI